MSSTNHLRKSTVEPQAALLDQLPASKLWRCTVCDREMQHVSKVDHLAGKSHAQELKLVGQSNPIMESYASSTTVSGATVAQHTKPKKREAPNTTENPQPTLWTCPSCDGVFPLKQKASHSCAISIPNSSGPLDNFFRSYPSFNYNASKPPATSFKSLEDYLTKLRKWRKKSPERQRLWEQYQDALTEEFNLLFGVKNDLDAWHALCRAVRINPLPTTCKECRSVRILKLFYPITKKKSKQSAKALANSPCVVVMSISSISSNGAATVANSSRFSAQ